MKNSKKIVTLGILVCFMTAAIVGCGTKEDALSEAMKKANMAKSVEAEATIDMGMKSVVENETQDIDMKYRMTIASFQEPLKSKIDINMDMGGMAMNIECYALEQNGEYVQYMNMGQLGGWMKQVLCTVDDIKTAQEKVNQMDVKMFMKEEYTYEEKPDVEENGKTYKVYTCAFTEEILKNLINSTDSTSINSLEAYSDLLDDEMFQEILASMKGLEFTIWIDPEEEELYRVNVSMGEVMQKVMQKLMEANDETSGESIDITKMDIDIIYKNYNKATDFELPSEALEAVDMSEMEETLQ